MSEVQIGRTRPLGQTTGSPQRPPQHVQGVALHLDLTVETEDLMREPAWQHGDRNAKTLVKEPDFRVVLTVLKSGARIEQHVAAGRLTIQALRGRLRVDLGDGTADLSDLTPGDLLALDRQVPHTIQALAESAFLLTLAWPEGDDATNA